MLEELTFDIVIATRNRPEALALSIPLILEQSRQPEKLIVIDSSDDHQAAKSVVELAVKDWPGEVILCASKRGSSLQRNIGLEHVTADVVFFPDDDSMLHPGTTEAIMRVYELDRDRKIAGVCAADAATWAESGVPKPAYKMSLQHRIQSRLNTVRTKIKEKYFNTDPYIAIGHSLMAGWKSYDWMSEEDCVFVPWMTGYRMSFRAEVIKQVRFDETLKNYALHEDTDASFRAMRIGYLIGARKGRIYHHRFPGKRADSYLMGVMQVMNRSYICEKAMSYHNFSQREEGLIRKYLKLFLTLKIIQSGVRIGNKSSRDQLRGMLHSFKYARRFQSASYEDLASLYAAGLSQLTKQN